MPEREPRDRSLLEDEQRTDVLTEAEVADLSELSQRLMTGRPVERGGDRQEIVADMWRDTRDVLLDEVIPSLKHFRRRPELEHAVADATSPAERARAERVLIEDTVRQLREEPSGFATTPVLARERGNLNCVMKSAIAATLFEDTGMRVQRGKVYGHSVVLVRDAQDRLIYADPNGIVDEVEAKGEPRGETTVYTLSDETQARLGIPYSRIVAARTEAYLSSMIGNLSRGVLTTEDDESRKIWEEHKDLLARQDWNAIRDRLFPDMTSFYEELEADRPLAEADARFLPQAVERAFGKTPLSEEDVSTFATRAYGEARACRDKESVLRYLEGRKGEQLPEGFSPDVGRFLDILREELTNLQGENDRLRAIVLRRWTRTLHPEAEPASS